MTDKFEREVPAEESPAEKSPGEIRQEKRDIFTNIVLNVINEKSDAQGEVSNKELDELGSKILAKIDLFDPVELQSYEQAGIEGLRVLAKIAEARKEVLDTERDIKLLRVEHDTLVKKDDGVEFPPAPESGQSPTEKRIKDVGEKSNP